MIENVHKTVHVILKRSTATNTFTRTAWLRQKEGNGAVQFFCFGNQPDMTSSAGINKQVISPPKPPPCAHGFCSPRGASD